MSSRLRLCLLFILVLVGGCATPGKGDDKLLEQTLENYASVIRWGNFEQALAFVDPQTLKEHPVTSLDLQRYQQVRVTGYNDQPVRRVGDGEARQVVEIGIVNVNTQAARSFIDAQRWRWDDKARRWWLASGLPDITAH